MGANLAMAREKNAMIIDFSASAYFSSQAMECRQMGGMSFCRRVDFFHLLSQNSICVQMQPEGNWTTTKQARIGMKASMLSEHCSFDIFIKGFYGIYWNFNWPGSVSGWYLVAGTHCQRVLVAIGIDPERELVHLSKAHCLHPHHPHHPHRPHRPHHHHRPHHPCHSDQWVSHHTDHPQCFKCPSSECKTQKKRQSLRVFIWFQKEKKGRSFGPKK